MASSSLIKGSAMLVSFVSIGFLGIWASVFTAGLATALLLRLGLTLIGFLSGAFVAELCFMGEVLGYT
jgi:hypothetical protein